MALSDYALDEYQREVMELHEQGLTGGEIARRIGKQRPNVNRTIRRVKARAALHNDRPEHDMTHPMPDPYKVKRHSLNYVDGQLKQEWVISEPDKERQLELMREAVSALSESIKPATPQPATCISANPDLCNVHILTDYHMGMLSWGEETGADWDTDIAEAMLTRWMHKAIEQAPDAQVGVLAQLGDLLHHDSLEAVTPASGNQLDADTRYAYMVRTVIHCMRRVISMMLDKYPHVHVVMCDANHDPTGGIWLREMFAQFLRAEPRVTVDQSPSTYNCFEWGNTSLFFHHGHKRKLDHIADVFAAQFREVFGRTKYSYAHIGHLHHLAAKETNLMVVEQHRTMAAKDAHAANGGYLSGRSADVITYSAEYGQAGRQTLTPEMVG